MFHRFSLFIVSIFLSTLIVSGASARDYYGAISFSSNGAHGYSYDHSSRRSAENAAVRACRNYGGRNCRVSIWFRNACGALAVTNRNGWGAAWGYDRGDAENKALNACYNHNNGCFIKRWVCTSGR